METPSSNFALWLGALQRETRNQKDEHREKSLPCWGCWEDELDVWNIQLLTHGRPAVAGVSQPVQEDHRGTVRAPGLLRDGFAEGVRHVGGSTSADTPLCLPSESVGTLWPGKR